MNENSLRPRTLAVILMIVSAAFVRFLPSSNLFGIFSNFTPIGAMALFGGCYFKDQFKAYLVPILALFLSDLLINRLFYYDHWILFYPGAAWVYAGFALTVMLGHLVRKVSVANVGVAAIGAATLHWLISDFGTWASGFTNITTGRPFEPTFEGLMQCYALGFPFYVNMVLGNLFFSLVLFGGFEWLQRRYPKLSLAA